METQLEMVDFGHAASDLMFDKTQFKADKEVKFDWLAERVLQFDWLMTEVIEVE